MIPKCFEFFKFIFMNHYVIEEDWIGVILQWLFLFGLLSIPFFSGWLFGRLAKKNQRERWIFWIVGTAIFVGGFLLGVIMEQFIIVYFKPEESVRFVSGLLRFVIPILLTATLYLILKRSWTKKPVESKTLDSNGAH